ncbi:MAG: hypothetical protein U1E22_02315 [Coriobacteriia bacterium]|nr:hypothetical protein [Coriobacteriia bacterium]
MSSMATTVTPTVSHALVAFTMSDVVVAALVAGLVSLITIVAEHSRARGDRLRVQYAEAFRAYAAYREFPYVIRRRCDDSGAERVRISTALQEVQSQLTFFESWIDLESPTVAKEYCALLRAMRSIAGTAMHRAWELRPAHEAEDMNIPDYAGDLGTLQPLEDRFVDAARKRLRWWRIR